MSTDVGTYYRSTLTVYDDVGALATPATFACTVTLPDQTIAVVTAAVDSEGVLHADYLMTDEGLHKFVWATTAPITSKTDYENATVFRSVVGLGEVRAFLHLSDTSGDEILRQLMGATTELIEEIVGTCVIHTITDEHIPGTSRGSIRLPKGPLPDRNGPITITSEYPGGPSWDETSLLIYPDSGVVEPNNFLPFWWGPWRATYTAGRYIIPQRVVLAAKEIIYDLWSSQRGLLNDPLMPDMSLEQRMESAMPPGYTIPSHAKGMLDSESMPGFA